MARSLKPLEELGQDVARALDAAATARARAVADARRGFLLSEVDSHGWTARFWNAPRLWAGGLSLVALAALAVLLTQHRGALTFNVDGAPGVTRTWLAAPPVAPLRLTFSEGTTVRLEGAARARVVDIDDHGASLSLESGRLHAEVVHQADSAWKVVAGPFTVAVTGTVFDVDWDPTSEQLAVSVVRGSVAVRDSTAGTEHAVRASETLRTSPKRDFELTATEPTSEPPPASASPDPTAALEAPGGAGSLAEAAEEPAPAKAEAARIGQWRELAKRGALREAYAGAVAAGFAASCAGASAAELLLLGDGARLSGKPEHAVLALLALRRRFPGDPRRPAAAFSLGKVAFDQRGAYEQAAEWFSTSLREQPNGPLSREASGRLIEALRRADDSAGARRAARDYLGKYPGGPHADLARSVLH